MLPGAGGAAADGQQRQARADAGVTAILHESPLVRYWDHDLGPDEQRLLVTDLLASRGRLERVEWPHGEYGRGRRSPRGT